MIPDAVAKTVRLAGEGELTPADASNPRLRLASLRPLAGNGIDGESPLANTISISFDGAEALNVAGKPFYPGSQATTTSVLTMYDDTNSQAIELVNQGNTGFQGLHSLFFQTTGCAYAGGCTP